jgi:hypothetical protein
MASCVWLSNNDEMVALAEQFNRPFNLEPNHWPKQTFNETSNICSISTLLRRQPHEWETNRVQRFYHLSHSLPYVLIALQGVKLPWPRYLTRCLSITGIDGPHPATLDLVTRIGSSLQEARLRLSWMCLCLCLWLCRLLMLWPVSSVVSTRTPSRSVFSTQYSDST